nr:hypothetical protein fc58 [uncultured bacterium]
MDTDAAGPLRRQRRAEGRAGPVQLAQTPGAGVDGPGGPLSRSAFRRGQSGDQQNETHRATQLRH